MSEENPKEKVKGIKKDKKFYNREYYNNVRKYNIKRRVKCEENREISPFTVKIETEKFIIEF